MPNAAPCGVIARREFAHQWLTPIGWVVAAVTLALLGYAFLAQVDGFLRLQGKLAAIPGGPGLTDLLVAPFFGNAAFVLLLVTPIATMRVFSDEYRHQTLTLLLAAPVSALQLVLEKYLGVCAYLIVLAGCAAALPLTLLMGGQFDVGVWCGGVVALLCVLGVGAAIGVFMSSLTAQGVVAAVSALGVLLFLWMLDWQGDDPTAGSALRYFALLGHVRPMLTGRVGVEDLGYVLALIVLFLGLTVLRIGRARYG